MSKNTGDTRFRKVDVDNIGQSNFEEDTVDDTHFNPRDVEMLLNRKVFNIFTLSCHLFSSNWLVYFKYTLFSDVFLIL